MCEAPIPAFSPRRGKGENEATREGMDYLHTELGDAYWSNRDKVIGILEFLAALRHSASMDHWLKDSQGAALLAGALRNDHG